MHNFNNPFAENGRKILLWSIYLKTIVRNILNTKRSTNVKDYLKQCIVLTIILPIKQEK